MLKLPSPRLLPLTIAAMTAVLGLKTVELGRAALGSGGRADELVAQARAATPPGAPALAAAQAAKPATGTSQKQTGGSASVPQAAGDCAAQADSAERGLLQDLRARRVELDRREDALKARESVLDAAEHRLSARVDELTALQKKLVALDNARKQREEANWQGLVKLYENMRPRDAATIFNDLEMPVLLQVLDRMNERKAALILAAMQPDRARLATAKLADMRLHETSVDGGQSGG